MTKSFLIFSMAFFLLPTLNLNAETSEEEREISRLIVTFITACKAKQFQQAHELTTGKEQKYYADILKEINYRNGVIPQSVSNYLNRMGDCEVNIVEIDKKSEKAVALCTLAFSYFDSKSGDEVKKEREVLYGLQKVSGKWKISYSKLMEEKYHYKNKTHPKKISEY